MLNKIMLIGNLGRDPELQVTSDGTPVTKFSLAVNRYTKTSSGERKEETEWFNIVAWRQLAEICEKYLHKGSKVYIEGRITQRKYTDREGMQRTAVDVIANDMKMLDSKSASSGSEGYSAGSSDSGDPFLPDFPDE
ncbi:MAG TPA: single-stranded DNA-binding protein [Ktedonobacteraceae bacterium]|nr:single-stranded DNA-binding protein [Ktedonobacteraceae bacterium]